jgi:CubicO group peptidase (beta-lactamase class C family)
MSLAGKRDDDFYTDDEVVAMLARQKELNFEPGTDWLYSNSGYFLLSQVVKRVTGQSVREYAQKHIFEALGMTHTHFQDDHTMIVPDRASGYAPKDDGGFRISMTTLDMVGDGGVFTSVDDLLYWVRNFYDDHLDGGGIVQASLRRALLASGDSTSYAFGLQHSTYRGLRVVSHGGSFVGFRADITHFPDQRFDVVTLCNVSTANPSAMARRVAEVYLGDQMQPSSTAPEGGPSRAGRDTTRFAVLAPERLADFAGTYYSDELDVDYILTPGDGGLDVKVGALQPIRLRPNSEVDFAGSGLVLHFQRAGGRATGFILQAGRVRNLRFVRR